MQHTAWAYHKQQLRVLVCNLSVRQQQAMSPVIRAAMMTCCGRLCMTATLPARHRRGQQQHVELQQPHLRLLLLLLQVVPLLVLTATRTCCAVWRRSLTLSGLLHTLTLPQRLFLQPQKQAVPQQLQRGV